jgi:DNA-binding SARP family transcriptional activator
MVMVTQTSRIRTGALHLFLLGGFRVEREGVAVPAVAWRRRSARQLVKLLATNPRHALHREQIFDILWARADIESARNSFAKALHAARHALEPSLLPRQRSSFISVSDDMVTLDANIVIDADEFQRGAHAALRLRTESNYVSALSIYSGVLLPEDRYEDWALERRRQLADLNLRLLLGLSELRESEGDYTGAIDCLCLALEEDQTREDAHRRLMALYAASGASGLALRQFEICQAELSRELNRSPHRETVALYQTILFGEVEQYRASS